MSHHRHRSTTVLWYPQTLRAWYAKLLPLAGEEATSILHQHTHTCKCTAPPCSCLTQNCAAQNCGTHKIHARYTPQYIHYTDLTHAMVRPWYSIGLIGPHKGWWYIAQCEKGRTSENPRWMEVYSKKKKKKKKKIAGCWLLCWWLMTIIVIWQLVSGGGYGGSTLRPCIQKPALILNKNPAFSFTHQN